LKSEVTRAANAGSANASSAARIIGRYIHQNGGVSRMSGGAGSGGTVGGSAGRAIAQRLGGFINTVGEVGLEEALRREGLAELVGRPAQEILAALLDRLGGPASTIDDVDARTALARLQEELLRDAKTAEDALLRDYFGLYLFEQFCRVFFEQLVQKRGEPKALSFLSDIKEFIKATLINRVGRRVISKISWAGQEGARLCSEIMQATLAVFVT
jgi:hypothetical protein